MNLLLTNSDPPTADQLRSQLRTTMQTARRPKMQQTTTVLWADEGIHRTGVVVQTQDWRLEFNAMEQDYSCPELLALWPAERLEKLLKELVSQHVPTWQDALAYANPPDVQLKRHEPGYR